MFHTGRRELWAGELVDSEEDSGAGHVAGQCGQDSAVKAAQSLQIPHVAHYIHRSQAAAHTRTLTLKPESSFYFVPNALEIGMIN